MRKEPVIHQHGWNFTKYLEFNKIRYDHKKTFDVGVFNRNQEYLGSIYWRVGWRRYVFEPVANLVFDTRCLKDIINYINNLMEERKK